MLRRCVRDLYSARFLGRIPRPISSQDQMPSFLLSRSKSSKTSQPRSTEKAAPNSQEEPSTSRSNVPKILLGTMVVGAAAMAAYQGYINLQIKDRKSSSDITEQNALKMPEGLKIPTEQMVDQEQITLQPKIVDDSDKLTSLKDLQSKGTSLPEMPPAGLQHIPVEEKEPENDAQDKLSVSDDHMVETVPPSQAAQTTDSEAVTVEDKATGRISHGQSEKIVASDPVHLDSTAPAPYQDAQMDTPKDPLDSGSVEQKSLAESYSLQEEEPDISKHAASSETVDKLDRASIVETLSNDKESAAEAKSDEVANARTSNEGKVVLDLIEAIHAAERKQAESDAYLFSEEKRKLKEKYEKELKDARARELMYAEEAAILEKELRKEKLKSAAALKEIQEKAEQNLREELQRKDEETGRQVEKVQELAKAEVAAAVAKEKASQLEQIAEANLNIDALCMAFYARSEEARQSHSVHKLALGTLSLEEALSSGSPLRTEVDSLRKSLDGIDKDSLLELALSSLPEEVLQYGTDNELTLKEKFDSLKGTLRHFSLIPAGGGGILAHAVARVASSIKVKEDQSGDGIESVISKVENLLTHGDLSAAADVLEAGLHGSEAEKIVVEWVNQARARAIAEQTLSLLHAYAASITFS